MASFQSGGRCVSHPLPQINYILLCEPGALGLGQSLAGSTEWLGHLQIISSLEGGYFGLFGSGTELPPTPSPGDRLCGAQRGVSRVRAGWLGAASNDLGKAPTTRGPRKDASLAG